MKKYKILVIGGLMAFVGWTDGYGQSTSTKYIMFCDGSRNTTSLGWDNLILGMSANNSNGQRRYNYHPYTWVDPYQYQFTLPHGIPQVGVFLDESIINANATDVLGIAHCIGGLGLRLAQQRNPNITGMVLNGVPNSGSKMLHYLTLKDPGSGKTAAEKLLEDILRVTKADNCDKCDVIGAFAGWVKQFSDGAPHLSYAASLESEANYGTPTQPYIIMYGLLHPSEFSFVGMLDSQGGDRGILRRCQDERKAIERATDIHKNSIETIKSVTNWWTTVLNATSGAIKIKAGDVSGASDLIKTFSALIKGSAEEVINRITKDFEKDQEMARRLRCIMAQQLLEAEWLIMMSGDVKLNEVFAQDIDEHTLHRCLSNCGGTPNEWECMDNCYTQAYLYGNSVRNIYMTFIPEPNDGLYTQSEMQLASGQQRGSDIIFPGVNHFQETTANSVHITFYDQIFTGAQPYGPEFFVPKN